jgi:hypothetical protein
LLLDGDPDTSHGVRGHRLEASEPQRELVEGEVEARELIEGES